jgi:hypothetical protein
MKKTSAIVTLSAVVSIGLSACGEIDQQAKIEKIYAGKKDTKAYDAKFGGDKQKWETAMVERNKRQNDYLRTDAKQ